ncbi:unnamed protein product [Cuscuta europaea]|uniref:Uncharacterized protein n=1 Tax=Cuscuta europaea TaxID=41803 RepID=A0A9P0ZUC4_CUSEU|nr:unnamed protein product [Cuscuta europaea]
MSMKYFLLIDHNVEN